jgi:hypothetical protein
MAFVRKNKFRDFARRHTGGQRGHLARVSPHPQGILLAARYHRAMTTVIVPVRQGEPCHLASIRWSLVLSCPSNLFPKSVENFAATFSSFSLKQLQFMVVSGFGFKLLADCGGARLRAAKEFADFAHGRSQLAGGDGGRDSPHVVGLLNHGSWRTGAASAAGATVTTGATALLAGHDWHYHLGVIAVCGGRYRDLSHE